MLGEVGEHARGPTLDSARAMQRLIRQKEAQPSVPAGPRWLEPLPLGIAYSVLLLVVIQALKLFASIGAQSAGLRLFATWLLVPIALLGIIAWLRDDDDVAAAVLFSAILSIGGLCTLVVEQVIEDRAIGGAVLFFMSRLVGTAVGFVVAFGAGYLGVRVLRALYVGRSRRSAS